MVTPFISVCFSSFPQHLRRQADPDFQKRQRMEHVDALDVTTNHHSDPPCQRVRSVRCCNYVVNQQIWRNWLRTVFATENAWTHFECCEQNDTLVVFFSTKRFLVMQKKRHVLIVVLDKPSDFEQLLEKPLQTGRHFDRTQKFPRGRVSSEVFERGRCDLGRRWLLGLWTEALGWKEINVPDCHGFCCPSWTEIGVFDYIWSSGFSGVQYSMCWIDSTYFLLTIS